MLNDSFAFSWPFDGQICLKAQSSVNIHYFGDILSKMSPVVMDHPVSPVVRHSHPIEIFLTYGVIYIQAVPVTNLVT